MVWIEECPSRNLICSRSPPAFRQSFAQVRRRFIPAQGAAGEEGEDHVIAFTFKRRAVGYRQEVNPRSPRGERRMR